MGKRRSRRQRKKDKKRSGTPRASSPGRAAESSSGAVPERFASLLNAARAGDFSPESLSLEDRLSLHESLLSEARQHLARPSCERWVLEFFQEVWLPLLRHEDAGSQEAEVVRLFHEHFPSDPYVRSRIALLHLRDEDLDLGIAILEEVVELPFPPTIAPRNLARAYWQRGDVPRAREMAQRALELEPDNPDNIELSKTLESVDDESGFAPGSRDHASWLFGEKRYEEAHDLYLAQPDRTAWDVANAAQALSNLERWDEALNLARQAIEIDDNGWTRFVLARAYGRGRYSHQLDEAEKLEYMRLLEHATEAPGCSALYSPRFSGPLQSIPIGCPRKPGAL
jgi:tetratricopeptide (TPR) repeat protein